MGTEGKYEGSLEEQCRQWIEEVTGESLPWEDAGEGELHNALKSGVALCRLVNKLAPGSIKKISTSKMPFPQRENIQAFCDAVKNLGLPSHEEFTTGDLFEAKDMRQVTICLSALGRKAYDLPGWDGPCLGRKAAQGQKSGFTVKQDGLWGKSGGEFKSSDGSGSVQ